MSGGDYNEHQLTHVDGSGRARMVDVSGKPRTYRVAVARAAVVTTAILPGALADVDRISDVVEAARFAGVMAAKQTSSLIPLCHPVAIDAVIVDVHLQRHRIEIQTTAKIVERTGVEMEALTACAVAALTLLGALRDPNASLEELTLWHKSGGKSGSWDRIGPGDRLRHAPPSHEWGPSA